MTIETTLLARCESKCELCGASTDLTVYDVPPQRRGDVSESLMACSTCLEQIEKGSPMDINHWRCLNDSMWSQVPAVQVVAWRMLSRLSAEGWPQDLLDMLYLDDELLVWAQATGEGAGEVGDLRHLDCNGALLEAGDTVTLTKDLTVKGANFTAKRGTAVRGISLVPDNAEQLEGRVNGQHIVILTKFAKKSNK